MFYYVYVLRSKKLHSLYIGYTNNLQKRYKEHNRGLNFSTKPYLPWELIHYEAYKNLSDALRRERYLKSSGGTGMLKRILRDYFYLLKSVEK